MGEFDRYYNENGEIDATRVALPTAIKTLFVIFVSSVLVLILIMSSMPLSSMRFFESVGLKDRALDMANLAANREQGRDNSAFSKYADALFYRMMLAEELYYNGGWHSEDKYLSDLCDSTYKYASISGIEERNSMIDSSNLNHIAPLAHANIYSFSDRVSNLNYYASLRLGLFEEFLINGEMLTKDEVLQSFSELSESDLADDFSLHDKNPKLAIFYCIFFGQLTEYIRYNIQNSNSLSLLEFEQNSFMNSLEQKLEYFRDFALLYLENFDNSGGQECIFAMQTQLYLTRSVAKLYDELYEASVYLQLDHEAWNGYRQVNGMTMMDFFVSDMLPSYIEHYNQIMPAEENESRQ